MATATAVATEGTEVTDGAQIAVAVAVPEQEEDVSGASLLGNADSSTTDVQEVNVVRKSKTKHLKTLVFSCLAIFWFILMICYPAYPAQPAVWCIVLFFLFYLLYLSEALFCTCSICAKCGFGSNTCRYVSNIMSDKAAEGYLAGLMATAPVFVMYVECYHYETRTRTVSNGNGGTRTETYQEKVVTWRARDHIKYGGWMDRSTQVSGLQNVKLMKMKLDKKLEYADEATFQDFERQRLLFRAMNNFDVHQVKCSSIF